MDRDFSKFSIKDLTQLLDEGRTTSVDLTCAVLNRIAYFDRTGHCLNAVPVMNPDALREAEESDVRRRAGEARSALDGIPFTVKDSYMVAGLSVASGSPAFRDLIANSDAATVAQLRHAGAVLIGKTNMPPMAAGGVQPGVYGYAKSPYHPGYLTAAFGSGSSNGAGTATAAAFGAFGLAEETLSSGRSPASNNGLVAYTPSRGLLSIRGNWPLFPTCDVVVPYARSVEDLLAILDVILVDDPETGGDFWRQQRVVPLPSVDDVRESVLRAPRRTDLQGLRFGVPRMFVGSDPHKRNPVAIRPSVLALWEEASRHLSELGAEVVMVDFPLVSNYERDRPDARGLVDRGLITPEWEHTEMGEMIARSWDDFLSRNGHEGLSSLDVVDGDAVFPDMPLRVYANAGTAFDFARHVELAKAGLPEWEDMPGYEQSLLGLERARVLDFEEWLERLGLDAVIFPANGDVARSDVFVNEESYEAALRNGVLFSNGNRAIRHLGVPTVSVPMGRMADISMPVNLTIAGPAYRDGMLIEVARHIERSVCWRPDPPLTPSLPSSTVPDQPGRSIGEPVRLNVTATASPGPTDSSGVEVRAIIECTIQLLLPEDATDPQVEAWFNGRIMPLKSSGDGIWRGSASLGRVTSQLDSHVSLLVRGAASGASPAACMHQLELPND